MQTNHFLKIFSADLPRAHVVAAQMGIVLDRLYGGNEESMRVSGRKAGLKGNHEPRWNEQERLAFDLAING
ncbi:hypothetical protein [Cupriavidus basilensis]|uniref:hypothetical protein n=1 Tax=Cupriavidus basilensis TaxID=68895 RepID=UPI0039F65581